jgi:hypothetical protein
VCYYWTSIWEGLGFLFCQKGQNMGSEGGVMIIIEDKYIKLIPQLGIMLDQAFSLLPPYEPKTNSPTNNPPARQKLEVLRATLDQLKIQQEKFLSSSQNPNHPQKAQASLAEAVKFFNDIKTFITNCNEPGSANRYLVSTLKLQSEDGLYVALRKLFPEQNDSRSEKKSVTLFKNIIAMVEEKAAAIENEKK